MFADDTNLFYSDVNVKSLFSEVCRVLKNIKEGFIAIRIYLKLH